MLTHGASTTQPVSTGLTQNVMIVNGSADILEMLEPVLDAGRYDVIFVEATTHAYSHIKRVQPDLVILCLRMDDADGLNVLSMLKLDPETRDIPVVTYTAAPDDDEADDGADEDEEPPMFSTPPAPMLMN